MAASEPAQADQWWSAFPPPRAKAPEISPDEVMQMFDDSKENQLFEITPPVHNYSFSHVLHLLQMFLQITLLTPFAPETPLLGNC